MASHDERIDRFWDDLLRSGQPAAEAELDTGLTQAIERFQIRYAVSPPESTRERVRQRVLQSQSTSHEMEHAMNLDAAALPLPGTNGRSTPMFPPKRPSAPRNRWHAPRSMVARAAVALLLLTALIGGIFIYSQGDQDGHPAVAPVSPSPAATPASSWLQYRNGPNHAGVTAEDGPDTPLEGWRVETDGSVNSEPAIADGTLYVGSGDGFLRALSIGDGSELWRHEAGAAVDTSPAVGETLVYVVAKDSVLHAIDRSSGASAWQFDRAKTNASPTLAGDVLYIGGNDQHLYALDAATGEQRWSFDADATIGRTPAYDDGTVYIGTETGLLFALDATTGTELWRFDHVDGIAGSTVVVGDTVYEAFFESSNNRIVAIDAASGVERWSFVSPQGDILWVPSVNDTMVTTASYDGNIYALDAATGAQLWQTPLADVSQTGLTLGVTTGYVIDETGFMYALDLASGAELWRFPIDGGGVKGPALVDGVLYTGTNDGQILAIADPDSSIIVAPGGATPEPSPVASPIASPVAESPVEVVWKIEAGPDTYTQPGAMTVDPAGNLWINDAATDTIKIISPAGEPIDSWGESGSGPGQFEFSEGEDAWGGIAFDSQGNIYVVDIGNTRVQKFDSDRKLLLEWGTQGQGDGQFLSPIDVVVDDDDQVYVSDYRHSTVQEFDTSGRFIRKWESGYDELGSLAIGPDGEVLVANQCSISELVDDGSLLPRWTVEPMGDARDCLPTSTVAFDGFGHVFVGTYNPAREPGQDLVLIYDMDGNLLSQWATREEEMISVYYFADVETAPDGTVYVFEYYPSGILYKVRLTGDSPATPAALGSRSGVR